MPLFHRPKPSDTMVSIPCIVPLRDRAERRQENRELAVGPPWFPAELPGFLAEMSRCHLLSLYGQRVELYLQAELHERQLSGLQGRAGVCWGMVAVPSMLSESIPASLLWLLLTPAASLHLLMTTQGVIPNDQPKR